MIIIDVPQGSDEWKKLRQGIPTASNFSQIYTPTGKNSASQKKYTNKLLAEWLTNKPLGNFSSADMDRGIELEPLARAAYSMGNDYKVIEIGLAYLNDLRLVSASPDALVGKNGLLEIKCPKAETMIDYLLNQKVPTVYIPQIQGQLWITDREWCDFYAYHPDFDPLLIRVERDENYIAGLAAALNQFIKRMLMLRKRLAPERFPDDYVEPSAPASNKLNIEI